MNHFEKKTLVLKLVDEGKRVIVIDSECEYVDLMKSTGKNIVLINPSDCDNGILNPFELATEDAQTIEEKEVELRRMLDVSDYGCIYAAQRLSDMSFLNDKPEWKERASIILKEYADKADRNL